MKGWLAGTLSVAFGLLPGAMVGCSGLDAGELGADAEEKVSLYLYPPSSTRIPAQVATDALLESNKDGTIRLDPGVSLVGQLLLPVRETDGAVIDVAVSGRITASLVDTWLTYQGQTNFSEGSSDDDPLMFEMLLPTGTYHLAIEASSDTYVIPRQTISFVDISPRDAENPLLLQLDPGHAVEIAVTYPDGQSLVGARVYTLDPLAGTYSSTTISATADGHYLLQVAFGDDQAQDLWLSADDSGSPPVVTTHLGTIAPPVDGGGQDISTFVYEEPSFVVSGQMKNTSGQTVPAVTIYAVRRSLERAGEYRAQGTSESDGLFSMTLPRGTYDLVFRPPPEEVGLSGLLLSDVLVSEGADTVRSDLRVDLNDVQLPDLVALELDVVSEEGSPVSSASVTLVSQDRANPGTSALTDAEGHARMEVGLGLFLLEIDPPISAELTRSVVLIDVEAETSLGALSLLNGFTSSLTFLMDDQPIADLYVQAWEPSMDEASAGSPIHLLATGLSDANGRIELVLPAR